MWECEWRALVASDQRARSHVTTYPLQKYGAMTTNSIISGVRDGTLFGIVEVDIEVKAEDREHFAEMQPIFKNTTISLADVGATMRNFLEKNKETKSLPKRALVGSYFGKKILLISPLLQWYLKKGLKITHVYQVIQYLPAPCFNGFAEEVSNARRRGDSDPDGAIVADTMKLLGNSAYGML